MKHSIPRLKSVSPTASPASLEIRATARAIQFARARNTCTHWARAFSPTQLDIGIGNTLVSTAGPSWSGGTVGGTPSTGSAHRATLRRCKQAYRRTKRVSVGWRTSLEPGKNWFCEHEAEEMTKRPITPSHSAFPTNTLVSSIRSSNRLLIALLRVSGRRELLRSRTKRSARWTAQMD